LTTYPRITTTRPEPLEAPLYVSRPLLPPIDEFVSDLEQIWASHTLTNMGPFHRRLETGLNERLGLGHLSLWNNGTTALLAALAALDLSGEVIVTPFTFPATVHAIATLGLTPVFADIDPETMTLSPERVLEKVTPATSAIVGTHIYGTFCDTHALAAIAREHSLRVVYDGAHSFGRHTPVFPDGAESLGDITMLSFHATKLFHSVEGGALITQDPTLHDRLTSIRNFGIRSEDVVDGIGMNGKMSELHAAMGLRVLSRLDEEIDRRGRLAEAYAKRIALIPGLSVAAGTGPSAQYFVLRVDAALFGSTRDALHADLRDLNIISRRYFYPLCSDIAPYSGHPSAQHLPAATRAASECLALPFHGAMDEDLVNRVCDAIEWHATTRGAGR
jgi:dTDP-4-amino-4,6-dideoxygalactose transaminase